MRANFVLLLILAGCAPQPAVPTASSPPSSIAEPVQQEPVRLKTRHLPNAVRVHPKVISGGLPEGDAGFEELVDMGVRTIITVDGARPDVGAARRYGLRYVHLPHGYDGIPEQRAQELAKAVRDLEGPIYIHCHHGKHRSPAAASVACVTAGLVPQSAALSILQLAGTSPDYRGLYQSAERAVPIDEMLLNQLQVEFSETAVVPPLAEAMVNLEHTHDHIKRIAAAGWSTPTDHPDLSPAHEALLLQEHFTELLRTDVAQTFPDDFLESLRQSEESARKLHAMLKQWVPVSTQESPPQALAQLISDIEANCKQCHRQYRDTPQP